MRFSNPVQTMKMLEIVRARETDDETLAAVVEVGRTMVGDVTVIQEIPGLSPIASV
jgi:3-hydroxyacyl-CoA dehydrogenase